MVQFKETPRRLGVGAGQPLELWADPARPAIPRAPDWRTVVALARRNQRLIVATAIIVAILCAVAIMMTFNQYVATATILFDPRNAKVTAAEEVLPDIGPDSVAIESLVQVAKSDGFLGALVEREGLSSNPEYGGSGSSAAERGDAAIEKLHDRLTIRRRGSTYVVDVSIRTSEAQQSARIANAAAAMMVETETSLRAGANQRAADFIGGKLIQLRERVNAEDAAIAKLRAELKITDAGQGEVLQERRVTELNQQLALADAHANEAKALVDQLRDVNLVAGALPSAIQSSVLSGLRAEYARLTREAADRETVLGARHPDVVATNAQLGEVRRQVAAEKDRLIASAKADYLEAHKREAALAEELRKAQADSGATDQQAAQLRDLERTEKSDQAVYEQLLERQRALSEMKGLTSDDIRVVSPAIAPTRSNAPRLPLILAASGMIGLFAGFAVAFAREAWERSSASTSAAGRPAADVGADAVVPLLALAPARDGRPTDRETAEWFERICASGLLRRVADGGVLLVTSPSGGEGKSTVAANVAGCLARGGADVLLMRMSPGDVQARRRELGLVDVAAGTCLLDEAVLWYGDDAPSVLPLGGSRESAVRRDAFLSGAALRSVIHDCRRDFHTVVIDAPSVLAAPALRVLGRRVDAVLMVVEWGKTDAALVDEAMECFEPRKVGVVVNKVDLERYEGSAPLDGNSAQGPAALMRATPVARRRGATPPGSAGSRARTRRPRNVVDREN